MMEAWQSRLGTSRVEETTLKAVEMQVERKRFNVLLRENHQGQFVRITEVGPTKHSIIIPVCGLEELCRVLEGMRESAKTSEQAA